MEVLDLYIEALIFAANEPVSIEAIQNCLQSNLKVQFDKRFVQEKIDEIILKYKNGNYAFEVISLVGGYQFASKADFHPIISTLLRQQSKKKLSKTALETLAVVAYKQPVTKAEIEKIRGVSCDYSIHKLLDKELISIKGRSSEPGRPLLYITSKKFMQHFGLNTLDDLPKLKEFQPTENEIGNRTDI